MVHLVVSLAERPLVLSGVIQTRDPLPTLSTGLLQSLNTKMKNTPERDISAYLVVFLTEELSHQYEVVTTEENLTLMTLK